MVLDPSDGVWKTSDSKERFYIYLQSETDAEAPEAAKHRVKMDVAVTYSDTDVDKQLNKKPHIGKRHQRARGAGAVRKSKFSERRRKR
eukprot:1330415-Amorphochlora_amoeboformis.AAC.1